MEGVNEVQGKRERTRPPRGAARRSIRPHAHSYSFEVRRKAVQLCLEEGFPVQQVAREMGVGLSTLSKWVRVYRDQGEAGLQSQPGRRGSRRPKVAAAVKTKVVELKRHHPDLGIQKISQFLRRVLFLPVSRETVRRTLHEQQLLKKRMPKPQRNPSKPRFFAVIPKQIPRGVHPERSEWAQDDIPTTCHFFRLHDTSGLPPIW